MLGENLADQPTERFSHRDGPGLEDTRRGVLAERGERGASQEGRKLSGLLSSRKDVDR
jgi:hypothetical protein